MTCLGLTSFILSQILVSEILGRPHKRLMELYDSDERLLVILETQIRLQESHVQFLERRLEQFSASASRYVEKEQYMSNALNNLVLLRRLITDWPALSRIVPKLSSVVSEVPWPEEYDVRAVVRALTRLQLTYELRTEDLAHGLVHSNPAHVNLTGEDCLNVALYYCEEHQHQLANQWLEQALAKQDNTIAIDAILESIAISKCFLGDTGGSAEGLTKLLNDFPDYKSLITNLTKWQDLTSEDYSTQRETFARQDQYYDLSNERMDKFNSLCRAATGSSLQPQHVLSCRYVHYNKTRLRLGPFPCGGVTGRSTRSLVPRRYQ
ncbi:prolyl 4-hydroxylase subunit alpha-2-like [Homalodisca vitripennis]|uniref:prolyl 4-hydroxylase subunit alpha-2-like n=1 Tax=Homalodisca vitripennis TaxID=197043 RepID=UPI001EEC28CE|nr:prolyl 4-hydroxylase subunit alpha-2-like [Homalodisca vitripennis]